MRKTAFEKTQEEFLKERAEVLGRAGDALSAALQELDRIEKAIDLKMGLLPENAAEPVGGQMQHSAVLVSREDIVTDLNLEIKNYNHAREHVKLRYYYLIVTREAVGFRRHKVVEKTYKIPPKKKLL
jgi:hypothetical protein